MRDTKTLTRRLLEGAVLAPAALLALAAHAAAPGIKGNPDAMEPDFDLVATDGYITQPDGTSIYSWGYGCYAAPDPSRFVPATITGASCPPGEMQLPAPTLVVTQGDIVKVTPSSKIVGDLALFMLTNNLKPQDVLDRGMEMTFPESVIGYFAGEIGQPPGGFPKRLQEVVLKGRQPVVGRPGDTMPPVDLAQVRTEVERKIGREASDADVLSYLMYPKVFVGYAEHLKQYADVSMVPTEVLSGAFFRGLADADRLRVGFLDARVDDARDDERRGLPNRVGAERRDIDVGRAGKSPAERGPHLLDPGETPRKQRQATLGCRLPDWPAVVRLSSPTKCEGLGQQHRVTNDEFRMTESCIRALHFELPNSAAIWSSHTHHAAVA